MKTLRNFLSAILLAGLAANVQANLITVDHNIAASGPGSIGYTLFSVSETDTVSLWTTGTAIDPVLYLLTWDGHLDQADILDWNDDCTSCGVSGGWNNSGLTRTLNAGWYVAIIGDYALSAIDALGGLGNTGNTAFGVKTGLVSLNLSAPVATIVDPPFVAAAVPEPGSLLLLGLALLLIPVIRSRRA
ncbi:MAG: DVUA0089 family protein [Casimicrobiaceae bacterium]